MSDLTVLMEQRETLLSKIRHIEECCEGIENENNSKRVTELNFEQVQLTNKKKELLVAISSLESKVALINTEISELSGTGIDKILEAIKKQRWYFFKNKTKILLDRDTGLLWANLNYFSWRLYKQIEGGYSKNNVGNVISSFEADGYSNWSIPYLDELKKMMCDKKFPFKKGDNYRILEESYFFVEVNSHVKIVNLNNWDCYGYDIGNECVIPCCKELVNGSDYAGNVSSDNRNYTEKERLQFTLNLFVKNDLWPIFDDEEVTEIYRKIYIEKPKLLKELQELEASIEELKKVALLSSEFDYTILLSEYDIESIDASIIKYYQAVQQWCEELLEKLDYYEKEKATVIRDFNLIGLKLSKKYDYNYNMTEEENQLLYDRQRYFQKRFSLGMNSVKEKIIAVKKQADELEYRLDGIDDSSTSITDLAELELEKRASFKFIAENTAKIIKNALLKIEFFEENHSFVMNAINIWDSWTEDYRVFKTTYLEDMKNSCEEDGIDDDIWRAWYKDWQQLRYAIELKVQPVIERGLCGVMPMNNESDTTVIEQLIIALNQYKKQIDEFYREERKSTYQKFVFQAGGELQDKFETESCLYKYVVSFQTALQEIIFNCKNAEDRIWILNWADSLLDVHIDEILEFVADNDLQKISHTILSEFAALKQKNYEIYLADAKAYGEEKARREKEYNALIFKMRKELMKQ